MTVFTLFLKCLIIVGVNIGLGYLISYAWHFYLFYPRKIYIFGKYHFYFSPGLLHRGKKNLIEYLHKKLKEYFEFAKKDIWNINFLTDFEKKAYKEIFRFIKKYLKNDWLPNYLKKRINEVISVLLWITIRHLTRSVMPRVLIELQMEYRIDLLDLKLDVYKLSKLFEKHVYKYILGFNICLFTLVGVINMALFLIL